MTKIKRPNFTPEFRLECAQLVVDKGYSVMDIYDNYFLYVKTSALLTETQKYELIKLLCKYITIFHNIHEDEIELALFSNNLTELFSK